MDTLLGPRLADGAEGRDDRILEQLALSTYETRRRFPNDADYDWYQAQREMELVQLVQSLAELTSAFGAGALDRDGSTISKAFAEIRRQAQALFEPCDDRLCSQLIESLERAERTLTEAAESRRRTTRRPFFGRLRWRRSRLSANSTA